MRRPSVGGVPATHLFLLSIGLEWLPATARVGLTIPSSSRRSCQRLSAAIAEMRSSTTWSSTAGTPLSATTTGCTTDRSGTRRPDSTEAAGESRGFDQTYVSSRVLARLASSDA